MKKYLFLILVSSFCMSMSFALEQSKPAKEIESAEAIEKKIASIKEQIEQLRSAPVRLEFAFAPEKKNDTAAKESKHKLVRVLKDIGEVYSSIVNFGDKVLSKKTLVALLVTVGPLAALLCKFNIGKSLISFITSKFTEGAVSATGSLAGGATEGVINGALNSAKNHPVAAGAFIVYLLRSHIVKYGPTVLKYVGTKISLLMFPNAEDFLDLAVGG